MFRLSHYLKTVRDGTPVPPPRKPKGPVVIWNLVRRCNLKCRHCYAVSADVDFPNELTTPEIYTVMDDLKACHVPVLILSGGEPLIHPDIFDISHRARDKGFYVALSSNGTLIDQPMTKRIAAVGYDYVGISVDGIGAVHDTFRGMPGSFDAALAGLRRCKDAGIKVGLRFTITLDNAHMLPDLLQLADDEGIDKFYLSHLVYAGRGNKNRGEDAHWDMTRKAMDLLIDHAWCDVTGDCKLDVVTGNNDADAIYLLNWVRAHHPDRAADLETRLTHWGGNASGLYVANIDNEGRVHPDTMWWHYTLGNVRERPFSEIWRDTSDPLFVGLKQQPRPVTGRCGQCRHLAICGGNTRVRALQLTGDPWAEDPACYLSDDEIGLSGGGDRLTVKPFRGARHEPQHLYG